MDATVIASRIHVARVLLSVPAERNRYPSVFKHLELAAKDFEEATGIDCEQAFIASQHPRPEWSVGF